MKTAKQIGDSGEQRASDYLQSCGFEIVDRNWRTRYCEIDIIAKKAECIFFIEVKTRKSATHGDGLEYITPKKLKQMGFAAELWVHTNNWNGEYQLAAVGITGQNIILITDF